jgi:hypothetical protein
MPVTKSHLWLLKRINLWINEKSSIIAYGAEENSTIGTRTKLAQVVAIDFFGANGRETVDGLLTGLETKLTEGTTVETSENARRIRLLPWLN